MIARSNNKVLGSNFEGEACDLFAKHGYWVHFITPDARGAQPFDIIAVKDNHAYAIECKTLANGKRYFSADRLEDNQKTAFSRWMICGNGEPIILIKQGYDIISIEYIELLNLDKRVDLISKRNTSKIIRINEYSIYGILAEML